MRAQVILTPAEAKRVIAKAVVAMEPLKTALKEHTVVMHPSSTTLCILNELGCQPEPDGLWLCGVVRPWALCVSQMRQINGKKPNPLAGRGGRNFGFSWVLRKGELQREKQLLGALLDEMGPEDVYVKTGNALDTQGNVGVLFAAKAAGTIGVVNTEMKKRGFRIVLPIGLEKLIPVPVPEAARESRQNEIDWSMGQPCGLMPVQGQVVTEATALEGLTGAKVVPIASGGQAGAEGSTVLVLSGDEQQVRQGIQIVESVKGKQTPDPGEVQCLDCPMEVCHYRKTSD